jgi:putative IMPACT (imprinted ancient) family translation regulator
VIGDAKLAKSIHTACKSHNKKAKRPADEGGDTSTVPSQPSAKKPKLDVHKRDLDYASMTPDELESSLALPLVEDEEILRATTLITNRAPVVLAFAVELLRFTMPEQPPSSRLSLAQAVVSANSRSKAVSLGMEKPPTEAERMAVPEGQPKVRIMGRDIPVLKRGGYEWTGGDQPSSSFSSTQTIQASSEGHDDNWKHSQKLTSRSSTFIAHASAVTAPAARSGLIKSLMEKKPELETASHNAWAIRTSFGNSPLVQEASFDDGESGCGKFMLELMREVNVTNTLVVLTRWYGGVMLGPDRWRLMRECINDALSAQRRVAHLSGEALWGLDPQNIKPTTSTVGMAIHRPEGARNYLLRSFVSSDKGEESSGKKTVTAANEEKQENAGKLLGALRLLFESWATVLSTGELDRRAWSWYVAVRPDVDSGPSGWGAKGKLNLGDILDLRRKQTAASE